MTGRISKRWRWWVPLLVVAAGLAIFGDKTPANALAEVKPTEGSRQTTVARAALPRTGTKADDAPLDITALSDRAELFPVRSKTQSTRDLFAPTTWAPPPPAPIAKAPPPPDPTPPMPTLTVIGKKLEAGLWEVYLTQGTQTLIAREGATLDTDLRVDRIAPPEMMLTQLSTGRSITLGIGDAQ
jgi:hypothetical protein